MQCTPSGDSLQSSVEELQQRQGVTVIRVDFLYKCPRTERITALQHPGSYGMFSHGTRRAYVWAGDSFL